MIAQTQKERAVQFREMHYGASPLVLPNAWDAASASILEQAGFQAVATTSSGVAASLGHPDGQHISRDMLVEVVAHVTRVVSCPVSVDLEAGYGETVPKVLETVRAMVATGAVGINIEDSTKQQVKSLVDVSFQVELLKSIREMALSMDMPLVLNARTDVFLLPAGEPDQRFEEAVQRLNMYRQAGADCLFPIGVSDAATIAKLVQAVNGPINVVASSTAPSIAELTGLGVARISFASGLMRATLAHLRRIARELLEYGTSTSMSEVLSGAEFRKLFEGKSQ
jgi:2-methylisocitrate lyase-like PEP mutase family enzyme